MRAWFVDQFGEPETLRLGELAEAPVPAGSVAVRVKAAGINFFDLLQIRGGYQIKPPFPFTPGAEFAGVREDTGERVFGFCGQGGYGDRVVVPESQLWPVPETLDFAEAAAFLVVYHTSWFTLVERARLAAGETLLVHAGASGTGMSAIQIGLALGARVLATAGSEEKLEFCRKLGVEKAINYSDPSWIEQAKNVDVIYDPVGGDVFDQSLRCLALGGRIMVVGFAAGRIPQIPANRLLLKNISVMGAAWGAYALPRPAYLAETQAALNTLLAQGKIRPLVNARYPLADAPRALRDVDQRKIIGKAVIEL